MFYTDDPVQDYHHYDAVIQAKLSRLPKCEDCANPIQDDEYFDVDGTILCASCLTDRYRKWTDEYLDWQVTSNI